MVNSSRKENRAKGLAFLRAGNKVEAVECFQRCVDITPEMALEVIKVSIIMFFPGQQTDEKGGKVGDGGGQLEAIIQ